MTGRQYGVAMATTRCPGCHALVPDVEGPVHPYVPSAPGCWRAFGEVQADESLRFGYPRAHRLVVDAYMAQHPGDGRDRRDRQSVFVHLVALCALLERGMPPTVVTRKLGRLTGGHVDFPHLCRAAGPGEVTVLDLVGAADLHDYTDRARRWADAVWESWAQHHDLIRAALDRSLAGR